jgi:beta-N-acetylhexosaminidase
MKVKPLIFGISGKTLTKEEQSFFKDNPVVGFILFDRNIESAEQLRGLTYELKNLYPNRTVPIFIDQEGGRVARIKPPISAKLYDKAEKFSQMFDDNPINGMSALEQNYAEVMKELKLFGIDSSCAPVADLRVSGAHEVIGDRSFGEKVEKVVALCSAAIDGIEKEGGIPVIKHMPGHGRALCDSHLELPKVTASLEELNQTDFKAFKLLSANPKVKWAMTAHIIFDCIDPDKPVTCSKEAVNFIRENIGFERIILTDAIEMLALHGEIGAKYGAINSLIDDLNNSRALKVSPLNILKKYDIIDENFSEKPRQEQIDELSSAKPQISLDFMGSLVKVAKEALESGCNIVLHCTGEFDQIKAIATAVDTISFNFEI